MIDKLKHPLSLFVVWHPDFTKGKAIANNLYSIFCRDVSLPLSRGLGVPIYYRSASFTRAPIPIDVGNATRNAILLLIDENYLVDSDFREYTELLAKMTDSNTRIYPIALCEQAYSIGCGLSELQFIRAFRGELSMQDNFDFSMKKIKTELLNDCSRLMMNVQAIWQDKPGDQKIPSPVKLFLSHAKKDGEQTAKRFKAFVDAELKLDVFFDTVDIADGYDFEQQIENNIENAALVVFHTDEYSAREWCRIEVLFAKRKKCPIVVVHDIKYGEKRAFPYLGNVPTLTIKADENLSFAEIVDLTLAQILNNLYQLELLESFSEKFKSSTKEIISIASPPELFNYIDIYKKREGEKGEKQYIVLYPEPPLGAEELKILNEIDKGIKFITPIHLPTLRFD